MGEYLERHTWCIAIPCKYVKSRLCEVWIHTSSTWFHIKKAPLNPLQLPPPLSDTETTVGAIAFTICLSKYQFSLRLS